MLLGLDWLTQGSQALQRKVCWLLIREHLALWLQAMAKLSLNLHHGLQLLANFPVMTQGSLVLQRAVRCCLIERWPLLLLVAGQ